jgi:hypothetical protein
MKLREFGFKGVYCIYYGIKGISIQKMRACHKSGG